MHRPAQDHSDFDIPNISIYPSTTNFWEHKRCFKKCVKDMVSSFFTETEDSCSRNCLKKHIQAQIFVSQKMQQQLVQLATQDPRLKEAFKKPYQRPTIQMQEEDDDE